MQIMNNGKVMSVFWLPKVTLTSWDGANSDYAYLEPNEGIKTVYRLLESIPQTNSNSNGLQLLYNI